MSRRLPILENLGLEAISETTHSLTPGAKRGGTRAVIHDILLKVPGEGTPPPPPILRALEQAFPSRMAGIAENDGFSALCPHAGMGWRAASLLRAMAPLHRQAQSAYSPDYMANTVVKHSRIAADIVALFIAQFDPRVRREKSRRRSPNASKSALAQVTSLDEDQIIRRYVNLVQAMLRTNYFQESAQGSEPPIISFKLDSRKIEGLPDPKPFAEIFVYAPDVEGVHLRGGPVARGGLRWSDRPEDFRTEVLASPRRKASEMR